MKVKLFLFGCLCYMLTVFSMDRNQFMSPFAQMKQMANSAVSRIKVSLFRFTPSYKETVQKLNEIKAKIEDIIEHDNFIKLELSNIYRDIQIRERDLGYFGKDESISYYKEAKQLLEQQRFLDPQAKAQLRNTLRRIHNNLVFLKSKQGSKFNDLLKERDEINTKIESNEWYKDKVFEIERKLNGIKPLGFFEKIFSIGRQKEIDGLKKLKQSYEDKMLSFDRESSLNTTLKGLDSRIYD